MLLLLCGVIGSRSALADPRIVLVAYPETENPFQTVYEEIVSGLKEEIGGAIRAKSFDLRSKRAVDDVRAWTASHQGVVASVALDATLVPMLESAIKAPVFLGASFAKSTHSTKREFSLVLNPRTVFSAIRRLVPKSSRVIHVYRDDIEGGIESIANTQAAVFALNYEPHVVTGLSDMVRTLTRIFESADPKHDTLWLSYGVLNYNEDMLLPFILRQAWENDLVVVTSNSQYARQGVLVSFIIDYRALGRRLGRELQKHLTQRVVASLTLVPLIDLDSNKTQMVDDAGILLNGRAARHLKLMIPVDDASIKDVFP